MWANLALVVRGLARSGHPFFRDGQIPARSAAFTHMPMCNESHALLTWNFTVTSALLPSHSQKAPKISANGRTYVAIDVVMLGTFSISFARLSSRAHTTCRPGPPSAPALSLISCFFHVAMRMLDMATKSTQKKIDRDAERDRNLNKVRVAAKNAHSYCVG